MMALPKVYRDMLDYHVCFMYAYDLCNGLVPCVHHKTRIISDYCEVEYIRKLVKCLVN